MIDAVLSYHANPFACGVTKYNVQLAQRLGVDHATFADASGLKARHPLISVKWGELDDTTKKLIRHWPAKAFDLLWHDNGPDGISSRAARTFYASEIGCPSTIQGNPTRGTLNVLTFGMAHKFMGVFFERLHTLLERTGETYTLNLSTGIHEGSPWAPSFHDNVSLMRGIFGSHLRVLGFLADDALLREIHAASLVALFYEPAARANNTTLWAGLEAGVPVLTNLDRHSPKELVHQESVFDIAQMTEWPYRDKALQQRMRHGGMDAAQAYSWKQTLARLQAVYA